MKNDENLVFEPLDYDRDMLVEKLNFPLFLITEMVKNAIFVIPAPVFTRAGSGGDPVKSNTCGFPLSRK